MNLRERKKLAAWRDIRAAAMRLFDERGYEAVTIDQITEAAGVSRTTFFNYFATKEAVVYDQDPQERYTWLEVMEARSADEPLWDSLEAILTQYMESLRDRLPLQRRLKAESAALRASADQFGRQFNEDLHSWVVARHGEDMTAILQLNLLAAAAGTAYQTWGAEEGFDGFMTRLSRCLAGARPAGHRPADQGQ